MFNVLAVLRNELFVFLTHVIEDPGEICARSNIYLHINISIILAVNWLISCKEEEDMRLEVGPLVPSFNPFPPSPLRMQKRNIIVKSKHSCHCMPPVRSWECPLQE